MPLVVDLLGQHSSHGILGAIRLHTERCIVSGSAQDGFRAERPLEVVKHLLLGLSPTPGYLARERMQRLGILAEVLDELSVEVDKSEERLQCFLGGGHLLLGDGFDLLRIGADLSISDDETQVLHLWLLK